MSTDHPAKCPACEAGLWTPDCTFTAQPAPAYLDPIRDELDRLRAENKALRAGREAQTIAVTEERDQLANAAEHWRTRSHQLTETLRLRTDAHARLVAARLACPTCSTLPIEQTPSSPTAIREPK